MPAKRQKQSLPQKNTEWRCIVVTCSFHVPYPHPILRVYPHSLSLNRFHLRSSCSSLRLLNFILPPAADSIDHPPPLTFHFSPAEGFKRDYLHLFSLSVVCQSNHRSSRLHDSYHHTGHRNKIVYRMRGTVAGWNCRCRAKLACAFYL